MFSSTTGSIAIIVVNLARDFMFMVIHLFPCHLWGVHVCQIPLCVCLVISLSCVESRGLICISEPAYCLPCIRRVLTLAGLGIFEVLACKSYIGPSRGLLWCARVVISSICLHTKFNLVCLVLSLSCLTGEGDSVVVIRHFRPWSSKQGETTKHVGGEFAWYFFRFCHVISHLFFVVDCHY